MGNEPNKGSREPTTVVEKSYNPPPVAKVERPVPTPQAPRPGIQAVVSSADGAPAPVVSAHWFPCHGPALASAEPAVEHQGACPFTG